MRSRRSLSFAGCGFLGIYHVGVAVCLRQQAPQLLLERIGGASAGALAACCLLCDLPLEIMARDFLRVVQETRRYSLGAFSPWFNLPECLLEGMHRCLPADAHERVSGRLHISLTRVSDRQNVVMSEFASRHELLQVLLCSCFIPGLSGLVPPKVRGVRYIDGAFSNNLPLLDEHTVTVSPFCGESDICPQDRRPHLLQLNINWANTCIRLSRRNLRRMVRILLPGRADFMASICQQGYEDAWHFLRRNGLLREGSRLQEGNMVSWIHKQELRADDAKEAKEEDWEEEQKEWEKEEKMELDKEEHQKELGSQEKRKQDLPDHNGNILENKLRFRKLSKDQEHVLKISDQKVQDQDQLKQQNQEKNSTKQEDMLPEQDPLEDQNKHLRKKQKDRKLPNYRNRNSDITKSEEKEQEKALQQSHQEYYAISLLTSAWSTFRQMMIGPLLARIMRHLSRSFTLCDQPHFDLALMQAPAPSHALCQAPPLTDNASDNHSQVKATHSLGGGQGGEAGGGAGGGGGGREEGAKR
ncbi:hypothetical protein KR009_012420 [Drosophila setifemur]|nr:hypothetical protein KR009_012420 [Drosophila setifemur]